MSSRPEEVTEWNNDHVCEWGKEISLDAYTLAVFRSQEYTGISLIRADRVSLKGDNILSGPADTILHHREQLVTAVGNIRITILSDNGTVTSSHLLLSKPVPKNLTSFRKLVLELPGTQLVNLDRLKAAVYTTQSGTEGGSSWQPLGFSESNVSAMVVKDGTYKFQIQRFSTPTTSPSTEDNSHPSTDVGALVDSVNRLFSGNPFDKTIPQMFEDHALRGLVAFLERRKSEFNIATLFAMPGSGKSRTVAEAVKQCGAVSKRKNLLGGVPTDNTVVKILHELEEKADPNVTVVVHFDEVQTVLKIKSNTGEEGKTGIDDLIRLAQKCFLLAEERDGRKFIFTGTNINASAPVSLGSHLKSKTIQTTGSFTAEFVHNLYKEYFSSNSCRKKKVHPFLERCRHNRRVTEIFLKNMFGPGEETSISQHYSDAVDYVARSISSVLGSEGKEIATPAACRIFRALVRSIADGGSTDSKGETKIVTLSSVSNEDLKYVAAGGLNVHAYDPDTDPNVIKVYEPQGCVMEILAKISRAVEPTAVSNLLSFLDTSRVKKFTLGWFFEALVVFDLQRTHSEVEVLLSKIAAPRHSNVQELKAVIKHQLWKSIPANKDGEVVWWVCDEMNLHQNRWIDVGYCTSQDNQRVIIECKSGLGPCKAAATDFFQKSFLLAKKHPTFQWISVFLCVVDPLCEVPPELPNLKMKIELLKKASFLATTLSIVRGPDKEAVSELEDSIASETRVGSGNHYPGDSQTTSPPRNNKRAKFN